MTRSNFVDGFKLFFVFPFLALWGGLFDHRVKSRLRSFGTPEFLAVIYLTAIVGGGFLLSCFYAAPVLVCAVAAHVMASIFFAAVQAS